MIFFPFEAQNREQPLLRFRQASEHRLLGLPADLRCLEYTPQGTE